MLLLGCGVSALTLSDRKWMWRTKNKWRHPEVLTDSILESLYLHEPCDSEVLGYVLFT